MPTMIIKAGPEHAKVLSEIGAETFIDAHKESAPAHEIDTYLKEKYTVPALTKELANPANIFHIITHENNTAGFSKMMLNSQHPSVMLQNASKMD